MSVEITVDSRRETNADVDDLSRPLSHAALVASYVMGRWPVSA